MNPYPGLRPFRADESRYFAGREGIAKVLTSRVRVAPLTILAARSGVGKSSLLTCRIIPELERTARVHYWNEWGGAPPSEVVAGAIETLAAMPRGDRTGAPVLVLDQFEDAFKSTTDSAPLWEVLADVANVHPAPTHVLVAMREEWLARWIDGSDYLPDALGGMVRLPAMASSELRRAISCPAGVEGTVAVEEACADAIVADVTALASAFGVAGAGEPALLQVVLRTLWDDAAREAGRIDLDRYEKRGRAEQIVHDFVWRELSGGARDGRGFDAAGRVFWSGLSRYLTLTPGVKAIVTAESLARTLRLSDLGVFGPAIVTKASGRKGREYLLKIPEARGSPPERLVERVESVLAAAAEAGFLKRQNPRKEDRAGVGPRYELTHDFLGHFLQQFTVAVDDWTRIRWRLAKGIALTLLTEIYLALVFWPMTAKEPIAQRVAEGLLLVFLTPLYFKLLGWLGRVLSHAATYPVARMLARGPLPLPRPRPRPAVAASPTGDLQNADTATSRVGAPIRTPAGGQRSSG